MEITVIAVTFQNGKPASLPAQINEREQESIEIRIRRFSIHTVIVNYK
jgi:hypothetical protein